MYRSYYVYLISLLLTKYSYYCSSNYNSWYGRSTFDTKKNAVYDIFGFFNFFGLVPETMVSKKPQLMLATFAPVLHVYDTLPTYFQNIIMCAFYVHSVYNGVLLSSAECVQNALINSKY